MVAPAAWPALPLWWLLLLGIIGTDAAAVVECDVAAMRAPNPLTRPRRRLWSALIGAFVIAVGGGVWFGVYPPGPPLVAETLRGFVVLCALAGIAEVVMSVWIERGAGDAETVRRTVQDTVGRRPVVVGAYLGAWPRATGAGTTLMKLVLVEQAAADVSMVAKSRGKKISDWYVRELGAVRLDTGHPLLVGWNTEMP